MIPLAWRRTTRDYEDLSAFAKDNLKPYCSPINVDLCSEEKKENMNKFMAMSIEDLDNAMEDLDEHLTELEEEFKKSVGELEDSHLLFALLLTSVTIKAVVVPNSTVLPSSVVHSAAQRSGLLGSTLGACPVAKFFVRMDFF